MISSTFGFLFTVMALIASSACVNLEDGGFGYFDGKIVIDIPLHHWNKSDFNDFFSELSSNSSVIPEPIGSSNLSLFSRAGARDLHPGVSKLFKRASTSFTVPGN